MLFGCFENEWRITLYYLILVAFVSLFAKTISIAMSSGFRSSGVIVFLCSPSLSLPFWQKRSGGTRADWKRTLSRFSVLILLLVGVYTLYIPFIAHYSWWLKSYLIAVPFWLLLETLCCFFQLIWLPFGIHVPQFNNAPWRAVSVASFWGLRWNRLFGDWLYQVVFIRLRRTSQIALPATFLVSGVLHEVLVSLPLHIVYDQNVWGWATLYFLLQYLGIGFERSHDMVPVVQRIYLWLVVLVPAPLVLNPGALLIFHFGGQ